MLPAGAQTGGGVIVGLLWDASRPKKFPYTSARKPGLAYDAISQGRAAPAREGKSIQQNWANFPAEPLRWRSRRGQKLGDGHLGSTFRGVHRVRASGSSVLAFS